MKLFQSARASFASLGIISVRSIHKRNWKILLVSLSYGSSCVSQTTFLVHAISLANSFAECTDAIFITAATISVAMYFAITVLSTSTLFRLIDYCEQVAKKSEQLSIIPNFHLNEEFVFFRIGSQRIKGNL